MSFIVANVNVYNVNINNMWVQWKAGLDVNAMFLKMQFYKWADNGWICYIYNLRNNIQHICPKYPSSINSGDKQTDRNTKWHCKQKYILGLGLGQLEINLIILKIALIFENKWGLKDVNICNK